MLAEGCSYPCQQCTVWGILGVLVNRDLVLTKLLLTVLPPSRPPLRQLAQTWSSPALTTATWVVFRARSFLQALTVSGHRIAASDRLLLWWTASTPRQGGRMTSGQRSISQPLKVTSSLDSQASSLTGKML